MAGANAQLHQRGHVGRFGQPKAVLHHVNHAAQIGAGVEQQHARLQRIGVGAFLDDRGAFAIVFAHHHQHAAFDAG